jgi:hypothetical protein
MQEIDINSSYYMGKNLKSDGWKKFMKSASKHFILALSFKIIYKITRNVDKIGLNKLTFGRIGEIILNPSNLQYAVFFLIIRLFYKLFVHILAKKFDLISGERKYLIRLLSVIFGKFVTFLVILVGKNSNIVFYTVLVVMLRSLFYFIFYNSERQMMNQNKMMIKHMYYFGVGLGYMNLTVAFKAFREKIKLIKFFDINLISPVVKCIRSFK